VRCDGVGVDDGMESNALQLQADALAALSGEDPYALPSGAMLMDDLDDDDDNVTLDMVQEDLKQEKISASKVRFVLLYIHVGLHVCHHSKPSRCLSLRSNGWFCLLDDAAVARCVEHCQGPKPTLKKAEEMDIADLPASLPRRILENYSWLQSEDDMHVHILIPIDEAVTRNCVRTQFR
jgi:hypothetical protein